MPRAVPRRASVRIDLTPRSAVVALVSVAAVWLLIKIWAILLVILIGLMIVGMVAPIVEWLEHRGLTRGIAIAGVFTAMLLAVVGFGALTVPRLVAQLAALVDNLPRLQAWVVAHLQSNKFLAPLAESAKNTRAPELLGKAAEASLAYGSTVAEVVAYAVSAVFLALYFLIDRDRMRGGLFALVPRDYHVRLSRIVLGLETIVGGYMRGQALTSLLMGIFTFIVLMIAKVENAVALSVFAAVADVLPYVGALLACGPAVLAAIPRGPGTAVAVLIALSVYQEFESRLIVPRVYGRVLRLPSSIVIIALLVGGKLLGVLGALISLPVAAGILMVVEELRFSLPGDDSDDPALRRRDARAEEEYRQRSAGAPAEKAAEIATDIAERRRAEEGGAEEAAQRPLTTGERG
jgi:predicted PurR-regulated permease PerM